jgi:hypothetical protein
MSIASGTLNVFFERKYQILDVWTLNCHVPSGGQRFLKLNVAEQASASGINVLLNWFEELKPKVPTEKKP